MILITGAAGKTGKSILHKLTQRNKNVRALVRHPSQIPQMQQLGAKEVIVGDLMDTAIIQPAMQGVNAIYHICPNMHPRELIIGNLILNSARSAGVQRFVYHSVLHPQVEAMPHHWQKMRVEEAVFQSGLDYTILQPAAYMQNILAYRQTIIAEGIYRLPYAVQTRLSMVDLDDVAEAAVKVLTQPGHSKAIYECCGTEPLSQEEVADELSRHMNRPIQAQSLSRSIWEESARASGMDEYAIRTLLQMFIYYEEFGFSGNPNVLTWLLERPPTRFAEFLKNHFIL